MARVRTYAAFAAVSILALILGVALGLGASQSTATATTATNTVTDTKTVTNLSTSVSTTTLGGGASTIVSTTTATVGGGVSTTTVSATTTITAQGGPILDVCFAKVAQCDTVVIRWINAANRSIYVEMYSFTSDGIRDALIAAHNRGIDLKIVVDSSEAGGQGAEYATLKAAGINILLDGNSGLLHDKVAIIDNATVLTGSYNWSAAAENSNDENLVVLQSQPVTNEYMAEFNRIEAVAVAHA